MTRFVSRFPHAVREEENVWIPMRDGVRLAARIWRPADTSPVPAILEFIPYRKRDGMARRDEMMHPWFAGHGYAAVRVDLRGSGDSEGLLDDEYCPQEQEDGLDVIAWLASRDWCSGQVGMIGISWGGFNGLQIAARRPPALRAIVTVGSTDDRYADDVHYMGGAQLSANFTWAQTFQADLSRPPDPVIVGERWREQWLERLENQTFFIDRWLAHRSRDDYWRHGSVCEDYGRIECAVFAVGGWADSYTNAVERLLSGLRSPRLGLVGPWGHDYPHTALPGPQIGFLQECLRWWDHWLKGRDTGIMDEPMLRVFVQEAVPPNPEHDSRAGRWVGVDHGGLASASVDLPFHLTADGRLAPEPEAEADLLCRSPQTLGAAAGEWCPYGRCADQPADQSAEDGASLCFDGPILDEAIEIGGTPRLELTLKPRGQAGTIVVRLNDVAPDGRSTRISYGVLDLACRDGFDQRRPVPAGESVTVTVKLCDTAYRFRAGHRIRVAVSTAYWPTIWPAARDRGSEVRAGASRIVLPLLDGRRLSGRPVSFEAPEAALPASRTVIEPGSMSRMLSRDYLGGRETMTVVVDDGLCRIDSHGLILGSRCEERYFIEPDDPLTARIEADWTMRLRRGDWAVTTTVSAVMGWEAGRLTASAVVEAREGETLLFSRTYRSG